MRVGRQDQLRWQQGHWAQGSIPPGQTWVFRWRFGQGMVRWGGFDVSQWMSQNRQRCCSFLPSPVADILDVSLFIDLSHP